MSTEHWARLEKIANDAVKSGLLPKAIDTPQKAFIIALKGNELGFSPLYAFERISVINGKATLDGQAMLRLIKEHVPGAITNIITPLDKENELAQWELGRPGQKTKVFQFTLEDAKKAGLLGKDSWKNYTRAMLRWRALSEGARFMFPDAIAGVYLNEEMGAHVNEQGEIIEAEFSHASLQNSESKQIEQGEEMPGDDGKPTPDQLRRLYAKKTAANWSDDDVKDYMFRMYAKPSSRELTWIEYRQLCKHIDANPKPAPEAPPAASMLSEDEKFNFEKKP